MGKQKIIFKEKALLNGNIITLEPNMSRQEAVMIIGNRIFKVGSNEKIKQWISKETEIIDLKGRTVIPGFIDAHAHPLGYGLAEADIWVNCSDITCIDDLVKKAEEKSRTIPKGQWIFGRGWPASRLERLPKKEDFDKRIPDHPVWFNDLSGSLYILNSKGLEEIGLTKTTSPPPIAPNSRIDKNEKGELTGILRDCEPWDFVDMPPFFSQKDILLGLKTMVKKVKSFGITTSAQIGIAIPPGAYGVERVRPWLELYEKDELDIRIRLQIEPYTGLQNEGEHKYLDDLAELGFIKGFGNDMIKLGALKIISDGWQGAQTGLMLQPYSNDPGNYGLAYRSQKEYENMIEKAQEANLQLAIHVDGDASAEMIINAFEKTLEGRPNSLRHRIEHARVLTDDQVNRIVKLGLLVCAAPVGYSREPWYYRMMCQNVGKEREHELLRHKELFDNKVIVCGGSDCHPCKKEWISPLWAIQFLTTQGPERQRFSVEDALKIYTINGAYAYFDEKKLGSIKEGKLADLVVLSEDLTQVPKEEIGNIHIDLTIVDGRNVF